MANNISNFLENKILDHCLNDTAYTAASTIYVALYTDSPSEAGGGTEVAEGAYVRQEVPWASAAASGSLTTDDVIAFPTASADWGTVEALGLLDASTSGNLLWYGLLDEEVTVSDGDDFEIAAGDLTVSLE